MNKALSPIVLALIIGLPTAASAQSAGQWLVQGGVTQVKPHVSSGALTSPAPANTTTDVLADTQATAQVTYMLTDVLALAVPLGAGFNHDIVGRGAIDGVGVIGRVHALPVTLNAQYRFGAADAAVRPYVVAGGSYVYFDDAQGSATLNGINPANPPGGQTGLSVKSKFAFNAGLGISVRLAPRWYLDASYTQTFLKTRTTLSTGQTLDATLNPSALTIGVAYQFK